MSAENDIGHEPGDGCIDTAIVRVYNEHGDSIEIEVTKSDRLCVCVCPSDATLKRLKRDFGGEAIVLTKEQERLILEQLAARAGYTLVPKDDDIIQAFTKAVDRGGPPPERPWPRRRER